MVPEAEEESRGRIQEEEEEEEEEEVGEEYEYGAAAADVGGGEAPTHLPFAPSPEFSAISTTVDPSYIISLIRRLLPHNVSTDGCLKSIQNDPALVQESKASTGVACTGNIPFSTFRDEMISKIEQLGKTGKSNGIPEQSELAVVEDIWEDYGCILWDLAANKDHAKFMVDNFLLDVLLMNLTVSKSARVTEISLGIIGNLACHDVLSKAIISTAGLIEIIIDQLTLNDAACLCEVCRLLTVSLQGEGFLSWVEALCPEYILQRILWIAENTLNSQLLEKAMEFLLAIISREEIANILLPSLIKLGLSDLVVGLLSCEMRKQTDTFNLERLSVLDISLQLIEVLSTSEHYSHQISSNEQLFQLLSGIVKLPDKDEVGNACEASAVIIANILTDVSQLASELSQDISFLKGLLDIFPFVTDDPQVRNAVWSILARLFLQIQENDISTSNLQQYVSVLLEKAYLIEDDLKGHSSHVSGEDFKIISVSGEKMNATTISLRQITHLLNQWIVRQPAQEEAKLTSSGIDNEKVQLFLDYCCKYNAFV